MSRVYFMPVGAHAEEAEISGAGRRILQALLEQEKAALSAYVPLKVHFGEKGNRTYLKSGVYRGIIEELKTRGTQSAYIESSVLYGGERYNRERHIALAAAHGFTQLPVVIADGARGEEAVDVPVHLKHFESCAVGKKFAEAEQVLVLSHFKGHMLAGFGGAIKQLSMGFAAKGGKMAMHMGIKPRIINFLCKKCKLCVSRCERGAITIGKKSGIDHDKCIGCGACFSICPHHAVSIYSLKGFWNALFGGRFFREKLVEYAYAGHTGKRNLYLTFAVSVTRGCDCEPHPMKPCVENIGVFGSLDPVAVDSACFDAVKERGKTFRGYDQLIYAEKIGLGSRKYQLVNLTSPTEASRL